MDDKKYAEVLIDGKIYSLSGEEDRQYLQKIAGYVSEKTAQLKRQEGFTKQSQEYQAVMVELNIADDYFKALDRVAVSDRKRDAMERDSYGLKHELVTTQLSLEKKERELAEQKDQGARALAEQKERSARELAEQKERSAKELAEQKEQSGRELEEARGETLELRKKLREAEDEVLKLKALQAALGQGQSQDGQLFRGSNGGYPNPNRNNNNNNNNYHNNNSNSNNNNNRR